MRPTRWTSGVGLRIALAALAVAALGVGIVAVGVLVVGSTTFAELMVEHGASAESAHAMFDESVTVVLVAGIAVASLAATVAAIVLGRRLVRTYLERERYQVVEASDGPSALAAIETAHPRLVVLDLMLPGIDGLAVIRAIRDERDTPVIVLSARGTANDRIVGLGLGADDYVPKPFSPAELVLRVNRVLARSERSHGRPTSKPLELGGLIVDRVRVEVRVDGRPVELTAVEFRLLTSLIEADGRVLSREQLIDAV